MRRFSCFCFFFFLFFVNINLVSADINTSSVDTFTKFVSEDDRKFNWGIDYMSVQKLIYEAKKSESSVKIAVLDCGFDLDNSVFKGVKIEDPFDVTGDGDTDVLHPNCSHGTSVAGIIATMIKNTNISLIPVKVTDDSSLKTVDYYNSDMGFKYALEKGADIINLSAGMYDLIYYQYYNSSLLDFIENDGIFVTSAGNNNAEISSVKKDLLDMVVVGAIDNSGKKAYFSNFGDSLDFVAPGTELYIKGKSVFYDADGKIAFSDGGQGTSFSSPQIAGILALLKLVYPNKTRNELVDVLKEYTDDLGDLGFDIYYGNGIPNFKTLNNFGEGRVWGSDNKLYENGELVTGWHFVDTAWYYFDSSGILQTDKIINNVLPGYGKGKRYVNSSGKLTVGWYYKYYKDNIYKIYFGYSDPDTGIMATNRTITIEGEDYSFNSKGKLIATGLKKMPKEVVGISIYDYYYFDKNSIVNCDKTFVKTDAGTYLLENGSVVNEVSDIGFLDYMYYPDPKTFLLKSNAWYNDGEDYYYFGSKFKSVKGLKNISGNLYFFDLDQFYMITKEFKTVNKSRYYFGKNGKALKGWNTIKGKVYYFGDDYKAFKGLNKIGEYYYYFQKNKGYMITNKLVNKKGKIWYFKDDGKAQKGWQSVDKNKYYFDSNYNALKGLNKIKKKYYYFNTKSGVMLVNSNVKVDGVKYHCDKNGVCKKK